VVDAPPEQDAPNASVPQDRSSSDTPTRPAATVALPDFAELAAQMGPSVVSVVSRLPPEPGGKGQKRRPRHGVGSGMVVRADGQVLTNHHVIADATSFSIEYADGHQVAGHVVYSDARLDLALISPEVAETARPVLTLSERVPRPGEWVMALGHPFGLGATVTVGVISGLGRDHEDLGHPDELDPEGVWSFIQTDASINLGNSGGPLVDLRGQVLGLTTAVRADGDGVAFAVPAAMGRKFLDEVWTHGRFRHARLGIDAVELDDVPGPREVVRVQRVAPEGPGARGGLRTGDLILAVNDAPISRLSELAYIGRLNGVGVPLALQVQRGPTLLAVSLIPDEAQLTPPAGG
jgi:S1-C subfamily serine protease